LFQHEPSGLALAVYRPYFPAIGRWLNRDPTGEMIGVNRNHALGMSMNLYAYVNNSPTNSVDLSGLQSWKEYLQYWYLAYKLFNQNPLEPGGPPNPKLPSDPPFDPARRLAGTWADHHLGGLEAAEPLVRAGELQEQQERLGDGLPGCRVAYVRPDFSKPALSA